MNLQTINNEVTMTSLDFLNEIINPARLAAGEKVSRYADFLTRVKDELDLSHDEIFVMDSTGGRTREVANLDVDQMLLIGMRESKAVRKSVLEKLKQLSTPQPKLPQTFSEALQLAADQARQLELQAPKVEFVDRYVESTGNKTFREVAKLLQANERMLRSMLVVNRIMYHLNNSWVVYAAYDKKGYFHTSTGERNGHAFNTVKFTPKGVTWVSEMWGKFNK
ncbi:MAG: hypothetical protein GY893_06635 [bacterium]|nr:hypothetical protein [bacterium]